MSDTAEKGRPLQSSQAAQIQHTTISTHDFGQKATQA